MGGRGAPDVYFQRENCTVSMTDSEESEALSYNVPAALA